MVIFQTPGGSPGYNQFESLEAAVAFVEQLRNDRDVTNARMFALEEIKFDLKPVFKVELQALNPGSPAPGTAEAPAPAAPREPAPAPRPEPTPAAAPAPEPAVAPSEPVPAPEPEPAPASTFGAFSGQQPAPVSQEPAPEPAPVSQEPAPEPAPAPAAPPPPEEDQPTRRGLFGR